jgi:DNA-directed RNA polymerase specialized sigma subunit
MKRIDVDTANIRDETAGSENNCDRRHTMRDRIDMLRARAELLAGRDHALMKMYLDNGNTFRQMARLAGVNEATISRRIHKLTQRLLDSEYITCLRNSDKFDSNELSVARDYFLKGLSQKNIAKERNCSVYSIRMALHKIQQIVNVESAHQS